MIAETQSIWIQVVPRLRLRMECVSVRTESDVTMIFPKSRDGYGF